MAAVHSTVVQNPAILGLYSAIQSAVTALKGDIDDLGTALRVPQMVVTGGQSAGKTSYIESMVGFRVGPTDRTTATRCPVRYVLRSDKGKGTEVNYFVDGEEVGGAGDLIVKREKLRRAVMDRMERTCRGGFSSEPIEVRIEDPEVVNIDIVDLPGLKASEEDAGAKEITAMVEKYLSNPDVIPVVIAKAEKSEENNLDVVQLQKVGLKLDRAVVVVNGINKQLSDLHSLDAVQDYMQGYKTKFQECLDLKFIMLHHNINSAGIDKDKMSQEEVEKYYRDLPQNELQSFKHYTDGLNKAGKGVVDPQWFKDLGVRNAHGTMVKILQDWTVANGTTTAERLRSTLHPLNARQDHLLEKIKDQEKFVANLEKQVDRYAMSYLSVMKGLRIGKQLVVPASERGAYRKKDITVDNKSCKVTFRQELDRYTPFQDASNLTELFKNLPGELDVTHTGSLMEQRLPCNKGIERLLSVAGYVVMQFSMRPFSEEEIEGLTGETQGMANAIDFTGVVRRIVQENLQGLFPQIFWFVLHHARHLIQMPQEVAHEILIQHSFPHMRNFSKFKKELDKSFRSWLLDQCQKCSDSMQDMLAEKISGVNVDIDTRLMSLLTQAKNAPDELGAFPNVDMPAYQKHALETSLDLRAKLVDLREENKLPEVFHHIEFVEGGLVDIAKMEYRQIKGDVVNRFAEKYFHFYKGLILLDMECKVRHHLLGQLAHTNAGDDSLHEQMKAVAAKMLRKPQPGEDDSDSESDTELSAPDAGVHLEVVEGAKPKIEKVAPIEKLKMGIDGKKWKTEVKHVRVKINKVEQVLSQLQVIMHDTNPPSRL